MVEFLIKKKNIYIIGTYLHVYDIIGCCVFELECINIKLKSQSSSKGLSKPIIYIIYTSIIIRMSTCTIIYRQVSRQIDNDVWLIHIYFLFVYCKRSIFYYIRVHVHDNSA